MILRSIRAAALSLVLLAGACNSHSRHEIAQAPTTAPTTAPVDDARQTLSFFASDELEGRGVETPGLDRAADYIADRFKRLGLPPLPAANGYFQAFDFTRAGKVAPGTRLSAGETAYELNSDFTPLSFSAEGKFDAPAVFVGYGITSNKHDYDDYANVDARGKVALAFRFEPHNKDGKSRFEANDWSSEAVLSRKAENAKAHGAVALLLVNPPTFHGADKLMPFAQRQIGSERPLPFLSISQRVADELLQRGGLDDLKTLQTKIDEAAKPASAELKDVSVTGEVHIERTTTQLKNVIGYLPGTGSAADEFIVVGAHYDHLGRGEGGSLAPSRREIHNGADDNASGTTAMLELAQRFSHSPHQRSIVFVAFTGEEKGLIGSREFVERGPLDISRVVAMVNLDMVGRVNNGIVYISGTGTAAEFERLMKEADEKSPLELRTMGKGGLGPSDHMTFASKKVPVLFLFSGMHRDYHRPTDDVDKINFDALAQVIDLAAGVITRIDELPRQSYVSTYDSARAPVGASGGEKRAALGVMPDYNSSDAGLRITDVVPDSPAAAAGLKAGDVILKIGDEKIQSAYDLMEFLSDAKGGQKVHIDLTREGKPLELDATLKER